MSIRLNCREEIAAPPERVFSLLTDLERAREWMPNFIRVERMTPGELGPGAQFRQTRKMFGREATEQFEITAIDPPRRLDIFIDGTKGASRSGEYRFRYTLEPIEGNRTAIELDGEIGGMGKLAEFFGRLFLGAMKKSLAADMKAMKDFVETARKSGS